MIPTTNTDFWTLALQHLYVEYSDGGTTTIPHLHSTGWRALPSLVTAQVDGPARLYFSEDNYVLVDAGESICVAPGIMHRCDNMAPVSSISRWSHVNCLIFRTIQIGQIVEFPPVIRGATATRLGDINEAFAQTKNQKDAESALRQAALSLELLALCLSAATPKTNATTLADWMRLLPVLRFIDEHLNSPMNREELANLAHLSPSHFGAVFRSTLGIAPGLYVQNLQILRAQALLLNTDLSVSEIAEQCGQRDTSHFSRLFKQHSGISPNHYRSRVRQSLI